MKKEFKFYALVWAILLVAYNVVVFSVKALPGFAVNYDARFWISWGFVIAAFIGQLVCAFIAFKAENNDKLFLNIPLIAQSYIGAVAIVIVGSVCMLIPGCPYWIAALVCVLVFAFSAVGVITAKAAAESVSNVGEKVKAQTLFIKSLTVDAETLMARAKSDEIKTELKKVYEVIRYSDPMSNDALANVESQITIAFSKLTEAVAAEDAERVRALVDELVILANDRNKKCKLLK